MNVLEQLAAERKLLCPETREFLRAEHGRVLSAAGRDFGPARGPLNLLPASQPTASSAHVAATEVQRMREALQLESSATVDATIAEAIAATAYRMPTAHLSAEARMLAERFRIPEFEVARRGGDAPPPGLAARLRRSIGKVIPTDARLEALSHSVGERLTCGQEVFRSVRVRNAVGGALRAQDGRIDAVFLGAEGKPVAGTQVSSAIPVDLEAGREITLIVRLRAPQVPGRYQLQLGVSGGSRAAAQAFLTVSVEAIPCELPVFDYRYFPDLYESGPEHHIAMLEAVEFLQEQRAGRPAVILEIGGGVHPTSHSLAQRGHRVVSCDVSHSQSILGALYFREKMPELSDSLGFISCDASRLPFADASFDAVMMVSAFHHFADPPGLLEEMKRVTGAEGLLYIAGETCAPNPADEQYLEELRRGINEQMWTLAEFTAFFRDAGLRVARARIDRHSLKVGLAKR